MQTENGKLKLSNTQIEVLKRFQKGGFTITTCKGSWWGGGCGDSVSAATLNRLEKLGLIDGSPLKISELGKSLQL